jgi:hypothetical protein
MPNFLQGFYYYLFGVLVFSFFGQKSTTELEFYVNEGRPHYFMNINNVKLNFLSCY